MQLMDLKGDVSALLATVLVVAIVIGFKFPFKYAFIFAIFSLTCSVVMVNIFGLIASAFWWPAWRMSDYFTSPS